MTVDPLVVSTAVSKVDQSAEMLAERMVDRLEEWSVVSKAGYLAERKVE